MCATVAKANRAITLFDISPHTYKGIVKALEGRRFRLSYDERALQLESSILYGLDWKTYSKLVRAFGDRHFRHTYQEGTLEIIMSPSMEHERIRRMLGRMVEMTTLECGIWLMSVGSTTRRAEVLLHGLEPDESYYVARKPPPRKGLAATPQAPDLAIEVELRRRELNRARSYEKLGVRELWRYHKGTVEILRLSREQRYKASQRSGLLPMLSADDLTRFVKHMLDTDEVSAMRTFLAWLRKQIRKSTRTPRKKDT